MGGNCWSRGQKVSLLLGFAEVECRPTWAPPISMYPISPAMRPTAISCRAHCLLGHERSIVGVACLNELKGHPSARQARGFQDWDPFAQPCGVDGAESKDDPQGLNPQSDRGSATQRRRFLAKQAPIRDRTDPSIYLWEIGMHSKQSATISTSQQTPTTDLIPYRKQGRGSPEGWLLPLPHGHALPSADQCRTPRIGPAAQPGCGQHKQPTVHDCWSRVSHGQQGTEVERSY